LTNSLCRSYTR